MKTPKNSADNKILNELVDRFTNGEKLSIDDLCLEYMKPSEDPYKIYLGEKKVRGWMRNLKTRFNLQGIYGFGNIDDEGYYGIVSTPGEANWYINRAYKQVKGTIMNRANFVQQAIAQGLLPESMFKSEKILLPISIETYEEEKKKKK